MTFAQRRNRLTTHFSDRIPVVKRRMTVQFSFVLSPAIPRSTVVQLAEALRYKPADRGFDSSLTVALVLEGCSVSEVQLEIVCDVSEV